MSYGKIKKLEFEGAISGVNELGEFIQDNEEAFVPLEIEDDLILDMIKSGAELEPRELESTEDEGKRWVQHECRGSFPHKARFWSPTHALPRPHSAHPDR